jgi:oxygen-independent coproporphyrinogen-3 oxidase
VASPDRPAAEAVFDTPTSLYIHVPFCIRRCSYCDFATAPYDEASADAYLTRLARELNRVPKHARMRTIYLGGGTPTALSDRQLGSLLTSVRDRLDLSASDTALLEWTCEANPESLTPSNVKLLCEAGVNRVSLGAQSFDDAVLATLGREHAPRHVFRAIELLRAAGFRRLSLDLMFAAPGETLAQLEKDLETVIELGLTHVSAYCLTYEPGSPLTRLRANGRIDPATEEMELAHYRRSREFLSGNGLPQYEISNFASTGYESFHNQVYWRGEEYFGVGLGAGGYEAGVRRSNTRDLHQYLGAWDAPDSPPHESETLEPRARAREIVVLGLRMLRGIDARALVARTGFALEALYPEGQIARLVDLGLLDRSEPFVRLTERGLELADEVFVDLV